MRDTAVPTSRLGRIKRKLPFHRSKPQKTILSAPTLGAGSSQGSLTTNLNNTPKAQAGNTNKAVQPPTLKKDLWEEAFKEIPIDTQDELQKMGGIKRSPNSNKSVLDDLIKEVQQRQDECEQKSWKFEVRDHKIIIRDYAAKTATWLQKIGDLVIQFAPSQAAPPWDVVKAFLQIPVNVDKDMAALLATAEKIAHAIYHGQVYESVYTPDRIGNRSLEMLQNALIELYKASLELMVHAKRLLTKSSPQKILSSIISPDKTTDCFSTLANTQAVLLQIAQTCEAERSADADQALMKLLHSIDAPLARIDSRVETFLKGMDDKSALELLEWISGIPYMQRHNIIRDQRTPGTGDWILQHPEFRKWEESSSSAVLWLQGSVGVGKTYLTSRVIDHVQDALLQSTNHEGFAFFYCDCTEKLLRDPLSVMQSYVRQLSSTFSNTNLVQTSLQKTCQTLRRQGSNMNQQACRERLQESLNLFPKTTLILDALDECDPTSRGKLISFLDSLVAESKNPVKVFISSRPDEDIRNRFSHLPNIEIKATDNQGDIEKYICARIPELAESNRELSRWGDDITTELLRRCQGMFQWVFLQLEQLRNCKSETAVKSRLKTLPIGLSNAYDEIYRQIEELEEHDFGVVKRAFVWLMCVPWPLSSEELLSAIRVDPEQDQLQLSEAITEDSLLSLCRNLLVLEPESHVWKFSHLSVIEYFDKNRWTLPEAHLYVGQACLLTLLEPSGVNNSLTIRAIEPTDEVNTTKELSPKFSNYADGFWHRHVRIAEQGSPGTLGHLTKLLEKFVGSPCMSSKHYQRWYCRGINPFDKPLISPMHFSIFAVCRFNLFVSLTQWWEGVEIDPMVKNESGDNVFTVAVVTNCYPICKILIQKWTKADINNKEETYNKGLEVAAEFGHLPIIKLLILEAGVDINMKFRALQSAARMGKLAIVKFLTLETGEDVIKNLECRGLKTIVGLNRNLDVLKFLLLDAGINAITHLEGAYEGSILEQAVRYDIKSVVRFLLFELGQDVLNMHITCGHFKNVLTQATEKGHIDILELLLLEIPEEVKSQIPDEAYISAWETAVITSASMTGRDKRDKLQKLDTRIVKLLIQEKGNLFEKVFDRETSWAKDLDVVKGICDSGFNLDTPLQESDYGSLLAIAAAMTEIAAVECLVEHGANVNLEIRHGAFGSVLAAAAATGATKCVAYLIREAKADINMPLTTGNYGSALAAAVYHGKTETVKLLISEGASLKLDLGDGRVADALEAGEKEVCEEKLKFWEKPYNVEQGKTEVREFLKSLPTISS